LFEGEKMPSSPSFSGFYKLSREERLAKIKEFGGLTDDELALLSKDGALDFDTSNRMVENSAGSFPLPLGFAMNFKINGRELAIPFAIEEPSVIAAASYAAKLALPDGFTATASEPIMIGQIQLVNVPDIEQAHWKIDAQKDKLLALASALDAPLVKYGGGARDIRAKIFETPRGKMLGIQLLVDCRDAMGANAVNTMCEALAKELELITGGKARLRIISNLAVHRIARASCVWKKDAIGDEVIEGVLDAYEYAAADIFRASTHNKGIMNGIDAVVIATGNDWRAVEAGAHAYAAYGGKYLPLTKYAKTASGDLLGQIELPMAVGLVGGATKTHPLAKIAVKILGVKSARELAEIIASVGLAQNFAALRALSTEGIQRGHMELHARNVAVMAGAAGAKIDEIAAKMIAEKNIRSDRAKELLAE
jgi:hydroxymethylglutaryl-CoA reductase